MVSSPKAERSGCCADRRDSELDGQMVSKLLVEIDNSAELTASAENTD